MTTLADAAEAAANAVPLLAVVIPTCLRPALLLRCLRAVLTQQGVPGPWEVLVVDDGPCPRTRSLVQQMAGGVAALGPGAPRLRYLHTHGTRGPAAARNRGWRASDAAFIAFTDDDTVPAPGWLAEGLTALADGAMAVAGRVVVPLEGAPSDHARMTQGLERAEFVTANAFVRRAALAAVGGFDERFLRAWREDSDLQFRLMQRYGEVARAPRAVVAHPVRPAPWGISQAQQENVCYDALLYARHPALFRARIRARPPRLYLLIVGASGAALMAWGARRPRLALALAGAALGGCAAFAARRLRGTSHAPGHAAEMLATSLAIAFLAAYWRMRGAWRSGTLFP